MKIGFSFEMDSSNRRDRRIIGDWLSNVVRMAPMFGEMVERLAPGLGGFGEPVGYASAPPPDIREVPPGAGVSSVSVYLGRSALRRLVEAWQTRDPDADFGRILVNVLGIDGADILAYVEQCGGLTAAVTAVWSERGTGLTAAETAAEERDAAECARQLAEVVSALGFNIPTSWFTGGPRV